MVVLSASGVNKSYGVNTILRDITFSVNEGDKIGVLGVNGAGKTTLFRLITGEEQPDEGELYISKQSGVAYMHQHAEYSSDKTAREEVLSVFAKLEDQERGLAEIERMLEEESSDELISKYNSLQESFIDGGGMTFRARAASALMGLGFAESEIDLPLSQISGGQRTRVLIAKLLLGEAKILLLDEPTNHLDVKAISWMEDFLREYRGTVLVISHDRFFLDRVTVRTFEIENTALKAYSGNYSYYVKKKSEDRAAAEKLYELKKKEIDRIEGIIEQQKRFKNLFWATSPLWGLALLLCAVGLLAVLGGIAFLIPALFVAMLVWIGGGCAISLVGLIYGLLQLFLILPKGLDEIGLGIMVAGFTMIGGILLYNASLRLMPYLLHKWMAFIRCFCRTVPEFYGYVRGEVYRK